MKLVYISLVVVVYVVAEIKSERTRSGVCKGCQHEEYMRIKRAKYYSSPPARFYNRPLMTYPIKGAVSFTPPPGYLMDDVRQPQNSRTKVSVSRPTYEGLGDEDVNDLMRFLSKQDFNKIMEFANDKDRDEKPNYTSSTGEKYQNKGIYNDNTLDVDENKFSHPSIFINNHEDFRPYSIEYNNHNIELKENKPFKYPEQEPQASFINKNKILLNTQLDSDRVLQYQQFSNLNAQQEANENTNSANIFNGVSLLQEEQLPKPSNLREDDFEISYTNNVPTIVKANSNSYTFENLGALPLMNYHSKLETVDSYKVPHYTVTSPDIYRASAPNAKVSVKPAPPKSAAQEQSDAHLKATKIWTHRSRGTAYTLHDDGTLSLEKPSRPKPYYVYPPELIKGDV